jgi:transposase-like protein
MAMKTEFESLYELFEAIPDEQAAIDYFKAIRWANGEFCPYCGHDKVYGFAKGKTAGRQWKCAQCREKFSIRVGTIFEDSKIPLRKWLTAIWFITSHKKGIASTQLAKDIDVTQKTAWFMMHRLRHAARTRSFNRPLKGIVEADESFFGGKERNKHVRKRQRYGRETKVIVFGLLERKGELRAAPAPMHHIYDIVNAQVAPTATLMTDNWPGYGGLDKKYERHAVDHSKDEYVRDGYIHVNSLEGYWSLLKRQIYGIHHWVSAKHLHRYINESVWRYNRREVAEAPRLAEFLTRTDGRLTYNVLIGKV